MKMSFSLITLCVITAFFLTGCADVRSKFIRKTETDHLARTYIPVHEYDVRPNMELYSRRYVYWLNWHKEFIDLIKDPRETNLKKITMALDQAYSNLYDMRKMLEDEVGDNLQEYIDRVGAVKLDIDAQTLTRANRVRVMRRMEVVGREIRENFASTRVAGKLRDDFRQD